MCVGVRFSLYLASWSSDFDIFFCVCGFWPPCSPPPPENGGGGPLPPPWIRAWTAALHIIIKSFEDGAYSPTTPETTCTSCPTGSSSSCTDAIGRTPPHGTRTAPARHPHGTRTAPAQHPHGTRTTHLLTVGSPHDCRPATGDRSYGRLTIKLFQFLKGTARTS